jgi:hypothetical protein
VISIVYRHIRRDAFTVADDHTVADRTFDGAGERCASMTNAWACFLCATKYPTPRGVYTGLGLLNGFREAGWTLHAYHSTDAFGQRKDHMVFQRPGCDHVKFGSGSLP